MRLHDLLHSTPHSPISCLDCTAKHAGGHSVKLYPGQIIDLVIAVVNLQGNRDSSKYVQEKHLYMGTHVFVRACLGLAFVCLTKPMAHDPFRTTCKIE